jgi:hypothetical protein
MNALMELERILREDLKDATFDSSYQSDLTRVQNLTVTRNGRVVYLEWWSQFGFSASINQIWYGIGADIVRSTPDVARDFTLRALMTQEEYELSSGYSEMMSVFRNAHGVVRHGSRSQKD